MDNKVKKIYVCPFCSAELNKQEGFNEEDILWKCSYCGNTVELHEGEDMKKTNKDLRAQTKALIRKTRPIVEFGVGLALIAIGTAVAAAEYFIDKTEKKEPMEDEKYEDEVKIDPSIEDQDHNII